MAKRLNVAKRLMAYSNLQSIMAYNNLQSINLHSINLQSILARPRVTRITTRVGFSLQHATRRGVAVSLTVGGSCSWRSGRSWRRGTPLSLSGVLAESGRSPGEEGEEEGKEGTRVSVVLAHFASRMDAFLASPDNGPNRIDAAVAAGAVSWSSYALFLLLISLLCVPCCAIWGILLAYSSLVEHDFAFMKSLTCNAPTPHRSSSSPSSLPLFARNRKPAD